MTLTKPPPAGALHSHIPATSSRLTRSCLAYLPLRAFVAEHARSHHHMDPGDLQSCVSFRAFCQTLHAF